MSFEKPSFEKVRAVPEGDPYPDALSRHHGEGGYTFLKRALRQAVETGKPVVINSGRSYLRYEYTEGQETFWDGVTVLDGQDHFAVDAFQGVSSGYYIAQGLEEIRRSE